MASTESVAWIATVVALYRSSRHRLHRRSALLAALLGALALLSLLRHLREKHLRQRLLAARAAALLRLRRYVMKLYMPLRALTQQQLEKQLESALDSGARALVTQLKDPAMPLVLQRGVDAVIDSLLPDIKQECWRWTDERFLPALGAPDPVLSLSPLSPRASSRESRWSGAGSARHYALSPVPYAGAASGGSATRRRPALALPSPLVALRRVRAAVLHTLWPHDSSLWMCMHSPVWWGLQTLGHMPVVGQVWTPLLASARAARALPAPCPRPALV